MVESVDIQSFLQNGYWANTRARTPDTRFAPKTATSSYSYNDGIVPRTSEPSASLYGTRRRFTPPPPTVEDETESLAKEHGSVVSIATDEEPQHAGDVDQYPIIQLLHEHNPERRFVLVSDSSNSSEASLDPEKPAKAKRTDDREAKEGKHPLPERKTSCEANICRKYVLLSPEEEEADRRRDREGREKLPNRERRKSRLEDLPAIVTDLGPDGRPDSGPRDLRRAKSATGTEPSEDYFSPRRSSRRIAADESMLSPDVIKHATKGRDRAYWDYNGSSTPNSGRPRTNQLDNAQYGKDMSSRRREGENTARPASSTPIVSKRQSTYDLPSNVRRTSKEGPDKGRQYPENPPSRLNRKDSSSSHSRPEREPLRPRSRSIRGKRESPPYDDDQYSSEEDPQRRNERRRRRKSFIHDERNGHLATPSESRTTGGRGSKVASPLASPRVSQGDFQSDRHDMEPSRSPRSATFPNLKEAKKFEPRYATKDVSPERPLSRASTARSVLKSAAPIAIPVITAAAAAAASSAGKPVDRRSSAMPPPPKGRIVPESRSGSRSSSSTQSSSPASRTWQLPKFDPNGNGAQTDKRETSYRRYSEDVNRGELPELPDCPRMREETGHVDWLTLPRCNNFNICPSCYQSAFQNSEFKHLFVPAPMRPRERPLRCDFGASTWYHIAWLLTHKYKQPDLRLFHGIANVSASNQPCTKLQPAYRIWYTIKDPVSRAPVRNFNICHNCAKTIEVLLPNLSGAFVPIDSPAEPTRGTCDMHQQGYDGERKRFLIYWEFMETTSDVALATHNPPDIRSLCDKIRAISLIDECYQDQPVANRKWYTMRSVPDLTVCEECFMDIIWPELERDEDGAIQADFWQMPQKIPVAACQLYSARMRMVFRRAVEGDDLEYFEKRVRQRKAKEQEMNAKIAGLDSYVLGQEWVDEEVERLRKEWRRVE
ncbi:hypothetical protein BJ170DRAFT_681424 [Xylariales sp. AK1849]|nr:hypothetical protein BJ170DRAFT_681424 [Xylariales sp. AK1849]